MHVVVAVEQPVSRIVSDELNDDVASSRQCHDVLDHWIVEVQLRLRACPAWIGTEKVSTASDVSVGGKNVS